MLPVTPGDRRIEIVAPDERRTVIEESKLKGRSEVRFAGSRHPGSTRCWWSARRAWRRPAGSRRTWIRAVRTIAGSCSSRPSSPARGEAHGPAHAREPQVGKVATSDPAEAVVLGAPNQKLRPACTAAWLVAR